MTRPPRRSWQRRLVLPLAVLAVAGGGWAAYAETTGTSHDYRTAVATVGDVSATLDLSGTVSASGKANLVASASGEIVAVSVEVGEKVRRGQVIARLDQTSLVAEVKSARASLAKAEAELASDEDAQTSSVTTTSTTSARSTTRSATVVDARRSAPGTASTATLIATIRKDQAAVTKAQTAASTALTTADDALSTEESACADASTATSSASDGSTDAASASPSTGSQVSGDCQTALGAVQSDQAAVSAAQTTLKTALDTLTTDLAKALAAATTPSSGSPSSGLPSGSKSGRTGSSGTPASSGTSVTAATLARDQASIDQARADLISAIIARKAAVVRAPSAGQVRSLSAVKGDSVSTGDDIAVIVGKGLTTVEIAATQAQAAELRLGTTANVTPAGSTSGLAGRVSRIAHLPTTSTSASGTSSTYAVEVTLSGTQASHPPLGMPVGVTAVIGTAKRVVTVPASAVSAGTVEILKGDVATRTKVTTGVVGTSTIQVLSGVSAGDRVVLADLDQDLPSSDSSSTRTGFGGAGGFAGTGGAPMGGPPGMG